MLDINQYQENVVSYNDYPKELGPYYSVMGIMAVTGTLAVKGVQGVTNVVANPDKSQVLVDFDEGTAGIEDAINAAISSAGVDVLG